MEIAPGPGLMAKFSIETPPTAVSATNCRIALLPPNLSAKYIINRNPAP